MTPQPTRQAQAMELEVARHASAACMPRLMPSGKVTAHPLQLPSRDACEHVHGDDTTAFTPGTLRRQNSLYRGRGGVSEENRACGFAPAFLDTETGSVYLSRFRNGRPAPVHTLDGLPEELIIARRPSGTVSAVKLSVMAGFVRRSRFYTRDEAASATRSVSP